jgi:hypothetical protein
MNHNGRWTEHFLNTLRSQSDDLADEYLKLIMADDEKKGVRTLFATMDSNDTVPPKDHFPELEKFFQITHNLPSGTDLKRIQRGEQIFLKHILLGAIVLLAKSLPEGYAAPNLSQLLSISNDLKTHPYKRLLGTLQMVLNVSCAGGFDPGGHAVITAQKLRLLHAGVRYLADRYRPGFKEQFGIPVNHEDMLGTIMGFSYLVVEGWRSLDLGLSVEEENDFFYVWQTFALMMGIHPPGEPDNTEYIPADIEDAARFYDRYRQRHYVGASLNPEGVSLARANLSMLKEMVPRYLRLFGLGLIPRIYMTELMGTDGCIRVGITPVRGHRHLKWILMKVHDILKPVEYYDEEDHLRFGQTLFQGMITRAFNGRVTFDIPVTLREVKRLATENTALHSHRA